VTGPWRWACAFVVAVFFAAAQVGGFHPLTVATAAVWLLFVCVDVFLIGLFVRLGQRTEEQNQARKGMIAELAQANQRLEEMIAENTGLQAQLLAQAREAGVGDERQRMAREIHDTLAQGLTGIITQLEAAEVTLLRVGQEALANVARHARASRAGVTLSCMEDVVTLGEPA
jgi:signal transduction histidine kinase